MSSADHPSAALATPQAGEPPADDTHLQTAREHRIAKMLYLVVLAVLVVVILAVMIFGLPALGIAGLIGTVVMFALLLAYAAGF